MVMRFGMSEKLGPRVFGHDHGQPFLGREFSAEPDYSDDVAREIDAEIRRIVEEAHQVARDILAEHRKDLDYVSDVLMRRETIEREESTRPGAAPVPIDEELHRVVPVVERLAVGGSARVSIDTTKLAVAETALQAGARIVNDVSAFRFEPEMAGLVASSGATCCLMHMLGEPRTMQDDPRYDDVVSDVKSFLEERFAFAVAEGVSEERVWLDPGIGFGK